MLYFQQLRTGRRCVIRGYYGNRSLRTYRQQSEERISVEEYFRLDSTNPDARYEYQDGRIKLMPGGPGEHNDFVLNVRTAFKQQFQRGPYFAKGSDMRVQVSASTYFFPGVTISCDVADLMRGNKPIRSPAIKTLM